MKKDERLSADLVVIGGGGAGLSAAVAAAERGASVIVLEKRNCTGGNTALATMLFAAGSPTQKRAMVDASSDELFTAVMDWAHWNIDPRIIRAFINKSGDTIRWLEEQGCTFELMTFYPNQTPVVTHRQHRRAAVADALRQSCDRLGVRVLVRTEVRKIIREEDGRASGVIAVNGGREFAITADAVVIATGGYGGNKEWIRKYCSNYNESMFCIGLPNMGDGIRMGMEAGAASEGLGMLQIEGPCSPRPFRLMIDTDNAQIPIMLTQVAIEPYAVWVNSNGARFMDETLGHSPFVAANGVTRQPGGICYGIVDADMIRKMSETGIVLARGAAARLLGTHVPGLERELKIQADRGIMHYARVDRELCNGCGICIDSCPLDIIRLDTIVPEKNERTACMSACPAGIDMRSYLSFLKQGMLKEALEVITENMPFPAITGRVCPHTCESECARREVDTALNINGIERLLGDLLLTEKQRRTKTVSEKKAAVIGSGPAGLACAYYLAGLGYPVTIFEAMPNFGGMLRAGIPEYRLPKAILDAQLNWIRDTGVEFVGNTKIGSDLSFDKLRDEFQTLFIATGNQLSRRISLEGIESKRVFWGLDFLRDVSLNKEVKVGKEVVVIGGGNVAVDVALTALRLGARSVRMVCLETGDTIPAHADETEQARAEGVIIDEGWGPRRITSAGIELTGCVSVFDETGRFNPCFDESRKKTIQADMYIFAIGQAPDLSWIPAGVALTEGATIQVDPITAETTLTGVFAGGDIVSGASTVVSSIAAGKRAAVSMDRYLRGEDLKHGRDTVPGRVANPPKEGIRKLVRLEKSLLPVDQRQNNFREVVLGLNEEMAREESLRCMTCGSRAVINPVEECRLCQACERNCPQKAVSIQPSKTVNPYLYIADTLDRAAEWMGTDPLILRQTIAEYNSACQKGHDAVFCKDRRHLIPLRKPPFYVIRMGVDYLDTIGGIKINEHMQVLDKQSVPIEGLFAAGIDTGGWVGDTYCIRTTGTTFAFAINSGRIAGENAADKSSGEPCEPHDQSMGEHDS
ncbi:MAG TPA: FAD-dependent oxidoreductase [Syntrophorhabdaceae bacterium]|nr:FAD-dependent oxidoreductase [Syntrophorhabdaceae bacterium]